MTHPTATPLRCSAMLRFIIRDVFWLTLVIGLAVGWWVDREGVATGAEEQRVSLDKHITTVESRLFAVDLRFHQARIENQELQRTIADLDQERIRWKSVVANLRSLQIHPATERP